MIELCAREIAEAYDDARLKMDDPVIFLIDASDSLGKRLCEHYELTDELSIMPLPRVEAFELLSGERDVTLAVEKLAAAGRALCVVVVAYEGATIEVVEL